MQTFTNLLEPKTDFCDTKNNRNLPIKERNRIIEEYLPLVRKIAGYVHRQSNHLEPGDLVTEGVFGLISAIRNYDPQYHADFSNYCKKWIRGAMLDELRRLSWVPRHTRIQIKEIETAEQQLQLRFNRAPEATELAEELNIPLDTLKSRKLKKTQTRMFSLNQLSSKDNSESEFSNFLADPRICQIHTQLISQLRKKYQHQYPKFVSPPASS